MVMPEFLARAEHLYPRIAHTIYNMGGVQRQKGSGTNYRTNNTLSTPRDGIHSDISQKVQPELMKTIFFTNRERIEIGDDHIQYMTYL